MVTSVKAVILAGGRVPLLRNEREEWELPGGRIEAGETAADAVEREVREELGLTVRARGRLGEWDYRPAGSAATVRIVAMDCALLCGDVALRLSDEHSDARWFSVGALDELVLPEPYPSAIRAGMLRG